MCDSYSYEEGIVNRYFWNILKSLGRYFKILGFNCYSLLFDRLEK